MASTLCLKSLGKYLSDEDYDPKIISIGLDYGSTNSSGVYWLEGGSRDERMNFHEPYPFQRYHKRLPRGKEGTNSEIPSLIEYYKEGFKVGFEVQSTALYPRVVVRHAKLSLDQSEEFAAEREKILRCLKEVDNVLRPVHQNSSEIQGEQTVWEEYTPERVVEDYLFALFGSWKRELIEKGYDERDILRLNCAVPAAWKTTRPIHALETAIVRASKRSGLPFYKIIRFWVEPEAALNNLLHMHPNTTLQAGHTMIVVDAGGGTVDLTPYRTLQLDPLELEEAGETSGGNCGSQQVDDNFDHHLDARLSKLDYLTDKCKRQRREVAVQDFRECKKVWFTGEEDPHEKLHFYMEGLKEDRDNWIGDEHLFVTQQHLKEIFDPVILRILALITAQIRQMWQKGLPVEVMFLVGGFAGSDYLYNRVKSLLGSMTGSVQAKEIRLVRPGTSEHAVAEGSLYCSVKSSVGPRRLNRCSIAMRLKERYNPSWRGHHGRRPNPDSSGERWVDDCILVLLKKGEDQSRHPDPVCLHRDVSEDQNTIELSVELYLSDEKIEDHHELGENCAAWTHDEIKLDVDISRIRHLLDFSNRHEVKRKPPQPLANHPIRRSVRLKNGMPQGNDPNGSETSSARGYLTNVHDALNNQAPLLLVSSEEVVVGTQDYQTLGPRLRRLDYIFSLRIEGLTAKWKLECPIAGQAVCGERSMTALFPPGTH